MEWQIEHLTKAHDRVAFSCGKPQLDVFLTKYAMQYEKRNLVRTYVAVRPGEKSVLGYFSLSAAAVRVQNLSEPAAKKLPEHPVPATLLARLAVDQSMHGQGLGRRLIGEALVLCIRTSQLIGLHVVTVDAIDEEAVRFYEKMGFVQYRDQMSKLYLPISAIAAGLSP